MKRTFLFFLLAILLAPIAAKSQLNQFEQVVPDELKYYKTKYDVTYTDPIELVMKAVVKSINDLNCQISQQILKPQEDGSLRGKVVSDYCVFIEGDSTLAYLQKYSLKMPFIRGGAWRTGRAQYKFTITQQPDKTTYVILKGNISGFEHFVTQKVHFWESNGYYETKMLELLDQNMRLLRVKSN